MDSTSLELYMYMGSHEPIIKWLKERNCKTKDECRTLLKPLGLNLIGECVRLGSSFGSTGRCVEKVLNAFED